MALKNRNYEIEITYKKNQFEQLKEHISENYNFIVTDNGKHDNNKPIKLFFNCTSIHLMSILRYMDLIGIYVISWTG